MDFKITIKLYTFASLDALNGFILVVVEAVNHENIHGYRAQGLWNAARIWSAVWISLTAITGIRQLKCNHSIKPFMIFSVISILLSLGVSTVLINVREDISKVVKVCRINFTAFCEGIHASYAFNIVSLACQVANILLSIASVVVSYEYYPTLLSTGEDLPEVVESMMMQPLVNADAEMREPQEL